MKILSNENFETWKFYIKDKNVIISFHIMILILFHSIPLATFNLL